MRAPNGETPRQDGVGCASRNNVEVPRFEAREATSGRPIPVRAGHLQSGAAADHRFTGSSLNAVKRSSGLALSREGGNADFRREESQVPRPGLGVGRRQRPENERNQSFGTSTGLSLVEGVTDNPPLGVARFRLRSCRSRLRRCSWRGRRSSRDAGRRKGGG